jgi:hypothetical protein
VKHLFCVLARGGRFITVKKCPKGIKILRRRWYAKIIRIRVDGGVSHGPGWGSRRLEEFNIVKYTNITTWINAVDDNYETEDFNDLQLNEGVSLFLLSPGV